MNKSNKWQYVIVLLILLAVILIGWVASESAKARKIAQTTTPTFDNWIETPSLPESDDSTATFTTPHPILSNVLVRRAMAYCTNKAALVQAVYPWMSGEQAEGLAINTFITKDAPYYPGDENITIYKYDPAKGQMLLDEAGWRKVKGSDYRVNASGDELTLKLTTTNSEFRQAWTAVWEVQMKQCGIRINRLHAPASWWFGDATGLARRDFEAGAFAWVEQPDPGGYTLWACDQIPTPQNYWLGQNYMGWCNKEADKAIKQAVNTLDFETRKEAYKIVQQEYTRDVPAIPLFKRVVIFSAVADLSGFTPTPGEIYYLYNAYQWERPTTDTIVIGFTQEPASLYLPVEKTTVASLAMYLVNPSPYLTLNYKFSPQLIETISTFESGLARNEVVIVKIGDRVVDASGEVVILEKGMEVIDATGTEVKVGDIPIQMHQLVVTYKWRNDLTWSDGVKLGIEDFKLGYIHMCDRNNLENYSYFCDRTEDIQFSEGGSNTYAVTYMPGYQDPLYFLPPYLYYPAHQVIKSEGPYQGKTLGYVPFNSWKSLPEMAENPIGVGPYRIVEWVKGEKIVYEANPYAPPDMRPKTPHIIIRFLNPEEAEEKLLAGEVDLLDSETLTSLSEQLIAAEAEGKVKNYIYSGATWEHIDFNLFVR